MRHTILIFIVFLFTKSFGQSKPNQSAKVNKELLVVLQLSLKECKYKAFKIVGDTVLIDTCYNKSDQEFTNYIIELVSMRDLYGKIITLTNVQWKTIEDDINKFNLDYASPFEISLKENSQVWKYSLKRIGKGSLKLTSDILESLGDYFRKL